MRKAMLGSLMVFAIALGGVGCSAPVDNTMNRIDDNGGDPNYPAGPYGYVEGSTVANYKFIGKVPQNGTYPDSVGPLLLGQFHSDPAVKLLLIEGSAGWCYYCNQEAGELEKLATDHYADGYRSMTILAEGNYGVPATADDATYWQTQHSLATTIVGIDPAAILFQYASASAFPVHILLDTSTMAIQWLCVGGIGGCDVPSAVTDALGK